MGIFFQNGASIFNRIKTELSFTLEEEPSEKIMGWNGPPRPPHPPRENSEKCRHKLITVLGSILNFSPNVLTGNTFSDSFLKNEILSKILDFH